MKEKIKEVRTREIMDEGISMSPMDAKIRVFLGKLGEEKFLTDVITDENAVFPCKGELISIPVNPNGEYVGDMIEAYEVINVLMDYYNNEFCVFVKPYNWGE